MRRVWITQLGTLASLGLAIILADFEKFWEPAWRGWATIGLAALSITLAAVEICGVRNGAVKSYRGPSRNVDVADYMIALVKQNGHCVMSSNDLSWASGDEAHQVRALAALEEKSKSDSLTLLMPQASQISERLKDLGADVYYYGGINYRFESRFTVANSGRSDEWVAIGHGGRDAHYIHELDKKNDPATFLALDLADLAKRHAALLRQQ